jgi:tetratricopeptide (TPR) repeat protein
MSSKPFLDDILGEENKGSTGPFLDEVLSSPAPEQPKIEKKSIIDSVIDFSKKAYNAVAEVQGRGANVRAVEAAPKYTPPQSEVKDKPVTFPPALRGYAESYFGLPRPREREGADLAPARVTPSISAMKPEQAKAELAKPLPMPKYTGSTGEQLLTTFMSNAAEGMARTITMGMLGGVASTPQGVFGETPIGIAGQVTGSLPGLTMMGKVFHVATQAIVKGLPEGMKAITEAAIKLGFTTDMLNSALHNSVGFVESANSGNTQGMIDSGSSALIDSLFAFMIAKGLPRDAKKLADFKVAMNAADASGIPRSVAINQIGTTVQPSEKMRAEADKVAYEPEIKEDIKTANASIDRTKNVRTKKYEPFLDEEFDELLAPMKEDLGKLKDWSDYPPDAEVAKKKGKKKEELVVEDFKEVKDDVEIKDTDFEIGERAPESLTTEASPFRTEKDVTVAQANNYAKSPVVAVDWADLTGPESVKSPLVTVSKLVNDFNQHLDGNFKGDIEQSKDFISKIAANVNEFEALFEGDKAEFEEFSKFVSDAAKWMRNTSKKGTGTSLYFGLPIDEAYNMMKPWFSALRKYAEEKLPNRATGAQIFNTLRKNSTKDEWEAVGLENVFRPEALIEKKDVLKAIDEGTVEFRDVILEDLKYDRSLDIGGYVDEVTPARDSVKFSSYVEPGGTNYKEMFVTAPDNRPYEPLTREAFDSERSYLLQETRDDLWEMYQQGRMKLVETPNPFRWQDGHPDYSDIENPIVRLRFNDRVGPNNEKVLFLEEVQPPNPENQAKMPAALQKRWREIGMKRAIKYAIDNGYDKVAWTTGEMQAKRYSLDRHISNLTYGKNSDGTYYLRGNMGFDVSSVEASKLKDYVGNEIAEKILSNIGTQSPREVTDIVSYILEAHQERNGNWVYEVNQIGQDLYNLDAGEPVSQSFPTKAQAYEEAKKFAMDFAREHNLNSEYTLKGVDLEIKEPGLRKLYDQDIPNVVKKLGGEIEPVDLQLGKGKSYEAAMNVLRSYEYSLDAYKSALADEQITLSKSTEPYEIKRSQQKIDSYKESIKIFENTIAEQRTRVAKLNVESTPVPSISLSSLKAKAEKGFSLYSGIPTDRLGELGKGIKSYKDKLFSTKSQSMKEFIRESKELGMVHWLNQSGNAKRLIEKQGDAGYELLQATALARGGHPRAINEWKQARKEYRDGLSKDEKELTDVLIMAKRVEAVSKSPSGKKVKYPEHFSPEESADIVKGIGSKLVNGYKDLSPQEELLIRKSADAYFNNERRAVQELFDEGLIGAEELKDLQSYDYSKFSPAGRPRVEDIFDKSQVDKTTKKVVYDSGIENIKKGGGATIFELNSELLMLESFDRLYNRVMINKAKKQMAEFARSNPSNPFVRVENQKVVQLEKQPDSITELSRSIRIKRYEAGISDFEFQRMLKTDYKVRKLNQMQVSQLRELDNKLGPNSFGYEKVKFDKPKGWKIDYFYEKGSKKPMWIEPKFASEWMTDTRELSGPFGKFVRIMSGTQLVKMFATGINPAFAIANLPRDVLHAWFASRIMEDGKWKSLYSVWAPKAAGEFLVNYKNVFGDVLHRRGVVNDFIEDGGGMNYLYSQGKLTEIGIGRKNKVRLETPFDKVYEFMSYINETSELLTRLAIRDRVIKRRASELGMSYEAAKKDPKIRKEATYAAIDQMNFGEGGTFTKALDNAIPYLNARIVGTRSLWRVFQSGSGTAEQSALKLGQYAALVVGLYLLNKKRNPQGMEDLKNDPRTNSSLAIPFGKEAGVLVDGQTRYPFVRVPIDSSQAFFKVLFEGIADKMTGGSVNPEKLVGSLKNTLPEDISSLPPTVQAIIGFLPIRHLEVWI